MQYHVTLLDILQKKTHSWLQYPQCIIRLSRLAGFVLTWRRTSKLLSVVFCKNIRLLSFIDAFYSPCYRKLCVMVNFINAMIFRALSQEQDNRKISVRIRRKRCRRTRRSETPKHQQWKQPTRIKRITETKLNCLCTVSCMWRRLSRCNRFKSQK